MSTSTTLEPRAEAPVTLAEPASESLGLRDVFGLWANLGISLLTVAVALPGALRARRTAG